MEHLQYLRSIKTLPALIKYLREELNWPIESDDFDEITFDYSPDELGIDEKSNVKIKEIKQLRPLANDQPWGIFFINFEPKQLPVVVLRRILRSLVIKKRASANAAGRKMWQLNDLLFISSYGDQKERAISFANFSENVNSGELPSLKVLGWDDDDTVLHLDDVHRTLKEKLCWPPNTNDIIDWRNKWSGAFTIRHREVISTSRELAIEMAHLATKIRKRVNLILKLESDNGSFSQLLQAFRTALIHDLSRDDFADMYAQTITYGLLAAKVSRPTLVLTENLADLVSNPFLKETLEMFLKYGGKKDKVNFDEAGILEVADLLNSPNTHIEAILHDFGNKTQREDPVIHFYELFLTEYDKAKKIERGVFYTPQPIVSFIVRSVHEILQNEYGLEDGLASTVTWGEMNTINKEIAIPKGVSPSSPFVTILDPAVGTGTFLVEVIDVIANYTISKWQKSGFSQKDIQDLWDEYVSKSLLPRIYGFELMMAPYVITDIKLTLKLSEISKVLGEPYYRGAGKDRFNIYLTNSLEDPMSSVNKQLEDMFLPLALEAKVVNKIKNYASFTVIVGNPPYSGESENKGKGFAKISELMEDYKKEPGSNGRIKEKNTKWINSDEMKFIRLGQSFIETNKTGILAFINSHSFLDNPTFRGLRWNLMNSFNYIFILDLHGNIIKKEVSPNGSIDENVFDITQGVSINLFVKNSKKSINTISDVYHHDLFGKREIKYNFLLSNSYKTISYIKLNNNKPNYLFINKIIDTSYSSKNSFIVTEMFPKYSLGFLTKRDNLVIDFEVGSLREKISYFLDKSNTIEKVCNRFNLVIKDNDKWDADLTRRSVDMKSFKNFVENCLYRPFDIRSIFYNPFFVARPNTRILGKLSKENIALSICRQGQAVGGDNWNAVFITNCLIDQNIFRRGGGTVFPLYLYSEVGQQRSLYETQDRFPNLNIEKVNFFAKCLGLSFTSEKLNDNNTFSPIDILDYIYAVLNSPTYRIKYFELLKMDFPRIPYPNDAKQFWSLVKLGGNLRHIHLLESDEVSKLITSYPVNGNNSVDKVKYENKKVWINSKQYFDNVPEIAWEFYIGGYQPAQKWLKDRKGLKLSKSDIEHYQKIIVALSETDRIMKEIDKVF